MAIYSQSVTSKYTSSASIAYVVKWQSTRRLLHPGIHLVRLTDAIDSSANYFVCSGNTGKEKILPNNDNSFS